MALPINETQFRALIKEVESELEQALAADAKRLSKAVEETPGEESEAPSEASVPADASPAPSPDATAAGSPGSPANAPGEGSDLTDTSPSATASEGMDPGMAGDEGGGAPTVDELAQDYASLPPELLQMHKEALDMALSQVMGAGAGPEAPPEPAPVSVDEGSVPPQPMPAAKNEMKPSPGNGGDMFKSELAKSEKRAAEAEAKMKALEAQVLTLTKSMQAFIDRPQRRAVTVAETPAPAPKLTTRAQVQNKISEMLQSGRKLSKSEQDLVIGFDLGKVSINDIQQLLK